MPLVCEMELIRMSKEFNVWQHCGAIKGEEYVTKTN